MSFELSARLNPDDFYRRQLVTKEDGTKPTHQEVARDIAGEWLDRAVAKISNPQEREAIQAVRHKYIDLIAPMVLSRLSQARERAPHPSISVELPSPGALSPASANEPAGRAGLSRAIAPTPHRYNAFGVRGFADYGLNGLGSPIDKQRKQRERAEVEAAREESAAALKAGFDAVGDVVSDGVDAAGEMASDAWEATADEREAAVELAQDVAARAGEVVDSVKNAVSTGLDVIEDWGGSLAPDPELLASRDDD